VIGRVCLGYSPPLISGIRSTQRAQSLSVFAPYDDARIQVLESGSCLREIACAPHSAKSDPSSSFSFLCQPWSESLVPNVAFWLPQMPAQEIDLRFRFWYLEVACCHVWCRSAPTADGAPVCQSWTVSHSPFPSLTSCCLNKCLLTQLLPCNWHWQACRSVSALCGLPCRPCCICRPLYVVCRYL
jgi:hypothetical protein